ncbi:MAG TPA: DNA mismatch repair endonuclease MutL [Vicinamibacteria bacterium]|nr:DNA mismatch repair endonuclease MutL [Vicinamibacteria bacterium]
MSRIERLSEDLVNKIAAGEVVERPASVVKELVENAIDAGAAVVHVEIEGGGRTLIRVRDDGVGMSRSDAELALERHATSKLREIGDLQAIATHGFRGEALPSIASVSDLVLRTRASADEAGVEVAVRQGRRLHLRESGHPRGATVEVRDLFGAVPARRKFLRAESTEAAHVAEAVTLLALARPAIGFFLRSGGRGVIDAPAVESLGPRVFQLFGARFLESLAPVDGGEEWARASGFVSRADGQRPPRASLRLFVNHRPVRDRALSKAVSQAYRAAGAGDRGFEAILFVDVPPSMVDVNVHPAKTEVRFADGRTAWTAVERSVRNALSQGARKTAPAATERVEVAVQRFLDGAGRAPLGRAENRFGPLSSGPAAGSTRVAEVVEDAVASGTAALRVLGQHRNTYIVATDGAELVLVDQHTAHERVRFERIEQALKGQRPESQLLLSPVVATLPPELLPLLEAQTESLAALGYDAELFGGASVRLRSVPALLAGKDPAQALEALLRDFHDREGGDWVVEGPAGRLAATLACHSAVRAGQGLAEGTMTAIVRDLGLTAHPALCPHGRPTSVRLPQEEVTRWFGRTGWRRQ